MHIRRENQGSAAEMSPCFTCPKACRTRWYGTKTSTCMSLMIDTRSWEPVCFLHIHVPPKTPKPAKRYGLHPNEIKQWVQQFPHAERTTNHSAARMKALGDTQGSSAPQLALTDTRPMQLQMPCNKVCRSPGGWSSLANFLLEFRHLS